jgi:hypothetical protein
VQRDAQQGVGPFEQPARERAVSEDEPHAGAQVGLQQHGLRAVAVLHRGGHDHDCEQQTEGVGDDETLAAVDLLPRIVSTRVTPLESGDKEEDRQ